MQRRQSCSVHGLCRASSAASVAAHLLQRLAHSTVAASRNATPGVVDAARRPHDAMNPIPQLRSSRCSSSRTCSSRTCSSSSSSSSSSRTYSSSSRTCSPHLHPHHHQCRHAVRAGAAGKAGAAASGADSSRRGVLGSLAGLTAALGCLDASAPPHARAEGWDLAHGAAQGVVDFWKGRQRQQGGIKLLAPLRVAQRRLAEADQMLEGAAAAPPGDGPLPVDPATVRDVLQRVRASSLNCYAFEPAPDDTLETKASLLTAKLELSDPCTFRIILKNVVVLEPPAVKAAASDEMDQLVRSYQKLDAFLEMARDGNPDALPRARQEIKRTLQVAADIEALVQTVLGV